jgi:UDP-N-acetylmuramoylalanine--D-glutamate ligase
MELSGRKVLVLGLGESGMAAARLLAQKGARVSCSDSGSGDELGRRAAGLTRAGCRVELGGHTDSFAQGAEMVVISPGIDPGIPIVAKMKKSGIPVIAEIELAYRFCKNPVVAITGTNGKTTTVKLLEQILLESGRNAVACGNIGNAFSALVVDEEEPEVIVIEVSSFQLEGVIRFKPWIAVALNVSEDHIDRYERMSDYVRAKAALFRNQTREDWAVVRDEEVGLWRGQDALGTQSVFPFSSRKRLSEGAYVEGGEIVVERKGKKEIVCRIDELYLKGGHNIENALAAAAAASLCGVGASAMERVLRKFRGLPHRMELVGNRNGITFINDSKATNPDAVLHALETVGDGIILIAGGRDKGFDYSVLRKEVTQRVKAVVLVGEASERMKRALGDAAETYLARDLYEAVRKAAEIAVAGDTILLSPSCSSFDMFRNFEERGEEFKRAVWSLDHKPETGN